MNLNMFGTITIVLIISHLGSMSVLIAPTIRAYPFIYGTHSSSVLTPIQEQYHIQDEFGQYAYGYSEPLSSKQEIRSLNGVTQGTYSYIDAVGKLQTVDYIADENGFRVAATNLPKNDIFHEYFRTSTATATSTSSSSSSSSSASIIIPTAGNAVNAITSIAKSDINTVSSPVSANIYTTKSIATTDKSDSTVYKTNKLHMAASSTASHTKSTTNTANLHALELSNVKVNSASLIPANTGVLLKEHQQLVTSPIAIATTHSYHSLPTSLLRKYYNFDYPITLPVYHVNFI